MFIDEGGKLVSQLLLRWLNEVGSNKTTELECYDNLLKKNFYDLHTKTTESILILPCCCSIVLYFIVFQ